MSERALLDTATIRTSFALNVASVESPEHVTAGMEQGYEMFDRWLAAHDAHVRDESEKVVMDLIGERDGWEKRITDLIYEFADVSEVGEWSSGNDLIDSFRDWLRDHLITPKHDARIRTLALAALDGEASDGYHTFDELYRYRMLYHAWAVRAWLAAGYRVVKSHRHADGEACFGGGYFVVYAMLPTGQVSNHYEDGYWDLFDCPEADKAPSYDGHTPQQAADRIHRSLTTTSKEHES